MKRFANLFEGGIKFKSLADLSISKYKANMYIELSIYLSIYLSM